MSNFFNYLKLLYKYKLDTNNVLLLYFVIISKKNSPFIIFFMCIFIKHIKLSVSEL